MCSSVRSMVHRSTHEGCAASIFVSTSLASAAETVLRMTPHSLHWRSAVLFTCALRFEAAVTNCMADFLFHGTFNFMSRPFNVVLGALFHDDAPFKSVQQGRAISLPRQNGARVAWRF